jgi:hypothetical protein
MTPPASARRARHVVRARTRTHPDRASRYRRDAQPLTCAAAPGRVSPLGSEPASGHSPARAPSARRPANEVH